MTRPIKFRGRLTANFEHGYHRGEFICGWLYDHGENYKSREKWSSRYWIYDGGGYGSFPVDEDSIAQLVGYDANGNEVYEGDMFVVPCGTEIAARFINNLTPNAKLKEAQS